jgi:hypothetical protein
MSNFDSTAGSGLRCAALFGFFILWLFVTRWRNPSLLPVYPDPISSNTSQQCHEVSSQRLEGVENHLRLASKNRDCANSEENQNKKSHKPAKAEELATPKRADLLPVINLGVQHLASVCQIVLVHLYLRRDASKLDSLISSIPLTLFRKFVTLKLNVFLKKGKLLFCDCGVIVWHLDYLRNLGRTRVAPSRITNPPQDDSPRSGLITPSTMNVGRSLLRVRSTNSAKVTLRVRPPRTESNRLEYLRMFAMSESYTLKNVRQWERSFCFPNV